MREMSRMTSWTGLFGSRSARRKPDPRIRWFGKLPTYGDYYSSGIDEDWVVEFNDWILEGFECYLRAARESRAGTASAGQPSGVRRLPLAGLIVRLPKSGMTVFAGMRDYGGDMVGRPFPLCFYAAVPTAQWPGPTSDRLSGATRAVGEVMGVHDEAARLLDAPGGFKSWFDDRQIDLAGIDGQTRDDGWLEAAAAIPLADWFDSAKEELTTQDLHAWIGRMVRWGERIAALESRRFKPTLSFPLAQGIDLHVQTAGWIRWLESRMKLKRRTLSLLLTGGSAGLRHAEAVSPAVVTRASAAQAGAVRRLVVIADDPSARDFLLLTPLAGGSRHVDDLCGGEDLPESARANTPPGGLSSEPGSATSWADFVQVEPKL